MYQLSNHTLTLLLQNGTELGANQILCRIGKIKPYLTKGQAFREYGKRNIESWMEQSLLTPRKDGDHSTSWRIDRIEAEAVNYAKEILMYL